MEKATGPRGAACAEIISKQENRCTWVDIVNLGECRKSQESSMSILQQSWTFITISKLDFKRKSSKRVQGVRKQNQVITKGNLVSKLVQGAGEMAPWLK